MAGDIPKVNVAAKDRVLLHLLANDEWADRYMVPPTMTRPVSPKRVRNIHPTSAEPCEIYSNPCSLRSTPEPFKATSGDRKHGSSPKKVDFKQINGTSLWRRPKSWCETWTENFSKSKPRKQPLARDRVEFAPNSPPCPTRRGLDLRRYQVWRHSESSRTGRSSKAGPIDAACGCSRHVRQSTANHSPSVRTRR